MKETKTNKQWGHREVTQEEENSKTLLVILKEIRKANKNRRLKQAVRNQEVLEVKNMKVELVTQ